MSNLSKWFTRSAEFVVAMMLAAIFVTFLIQIFSRYASKIAWMMPIPPIADWMASLEPLGWTVNLISLLWVWLIFFGCAFIVREIEHVTFDVLYLALSVRAQRILAYISAIAIIVAMIYVLPSMWEAVFDNRLMDLKKIQTLRMPFTGDKIPVKWLFASVILLMVVMLLRYLWRLVTIAVYGPPGTELEQLTMGEAGKDGEQ